MDLEPLPPESDPFGPEAGPGAVSSDVGSPRRSRRLMAGALAAVTLVGGGWAAGAAIGVSASGSSGSTASAANGAAASADRTATPCPAPGRRLGGIGKVATVTGTTFTITGPRGGATTVHTDGTTKFTKVTTGAVGDAAPGTRVVAHGTANPDGSIAADQLVLVPAPPTGHNATLPSGAAPKARLGPRGLALGTVASNSTDSTGKGTLTLTTTAGTTTIATSAKTVVVKTVAATIGDVRVGEMVVASGPVGTDGSITARQVRILDAALGGLGAMGPFGGSGALGGFPGSAGHRHPGFGARRPAGATGAVGGSSPTPSTTLKGKAPATGTTTPSAHPRSGLRFGACGAPRTGTGSPSGSPGPHIATNPGPASAGFDNPGQGGLTGF
jgi:Domain of unknown function (DUF5666)